MSIGEGRPPDVGAGPRGPGLPAVEEPPPFLGSWGRLYAAVLGWLALLVLLFYFLTARFS